jgi:RNA polymerase sigma-70 factor (ECF subfamily)
VKRADVQALFERYGPQVYRRARHLLGSHEEAEEATQEVFLRALRSGEGFEGRSQVSTWLYSITTHHCLNQIRNRSRRRELWDATVAPGDLTPARFGADPQALLLLRQLLAEVPDERWATAAVYVHVDGMSHEEAAEVLGVSRRTVGNLVERFGAWARTRAAGPEEVK